MATLFFRSPRSLAANALLAVSRSRACRSTFEDGTGGDVDLSYLLDYSGVFEPLRDPDYFRQLNADPEAGTIVWPNDADIAPETLYALAQGRAAASA
jgi:hypothetical protein